MTEAQANEYLRHRLWQKAKDIYDSIVGASGSDQPASGRRHSKEQVIACLYGRTECCLELRQYDQVTQDCHRLLKLLALAENAAGSNGTSSGPNSNGAAAGPSSSSTESPSPTPSSSSTGSSSSSKGGGTGASKT
uniref:Uncharacterized protein n=1 Tax=Anopheles melas TaxID=34690 RepID=A0A182TZA0_9DIPT